MGGIPTLTAATRAVLQASEDPQAGAHQIPRRQLHQLDVNSPTLSGLRAHCLRMGGSERQEEEITGDRD